MDGEALGALITRFGIKAPDTKNDLSPPFPFNLMFKVQCARLAPAAPLAPPAQRAP
jgi:hypothetical protein